MVLDLANIFFSIPLHLESQDQFIFAWDGQEWVFQALPQTYLHDPTICHGMIAHGLSLSPPTTHS